LLEDEVCPKVVNAGVTVGINQHWQKKASISKVDSKWLFAGTHEGNDRSSLNSLTNDDE